MSTQERYLRFPLGRRVEHWITVVSFTMLALTGLPQKYIDFPISESILELLGGIEAVRVIHRVAAVVLAFVSIYHVGYAIYHWYVKRGPLTMLPTLADVRAGWRSLLYNLGSSKERPKQGYYTFEEKIEYWSLFWGIGIMVVTGFFLWNPITAARILPGQYIPAAKAAHGGEALLAVLAIIVWHLYHVLVRHFNMSMFTGYMSREEMEKEHPLALETDARRAPTPPDARILRRRKQFWVGYGILALAWVGGVVWFVAGEQTASATPAETVEIQRVERYSPLTPTPYPTSQPVAAQRVIGATWEDGLGTLISNRCGDCHNPRNGEANLDLTSYTGALQGGDSGPAIVPYGPGVSPMVIWPSFDDHPGELSSSEFVAVRTWIQNGAPEK